MTYRPFIHAQFIVEINETLLILFEGYFTSITQPIVHFTILIIFCSLLKLTEIYLFATYESKK